MPQGMKMRAAGVRTWERSELVVMSDLRGFPAGVEDDCAPPS